MKCFAEEPNETYMTECTVYYCSVEEVYQNQKKLEAESKQLQVHAGN